MSLLHGVLLYLIVGEFIVALYMTFSRRLLRHMAQASCLSVALYGCAVMVVTWVGDAETGMTQDTFEKFQQPERGRFGDNEHRSRQRVNLTLTFRCEKPLAIAVTDPAGAKAAWIWLPKSQIEFVKVSPTVATVTLPEWLAKDKGLI